VAAISMPMLSYGIHEDQEMPKTEERVLSDQTSGNTDDPDRLSLVHQLSASRHWKAPKTSEHCRHEILNSLCTTLLKNCAFLPPRPT
jgi:hypothetical protein